MRKNQKGEFLSSRVRYIAIGAVRPNPQQPRRSFDETALRELADSIRAYGILQPLTVRDKGGYYELVAGERRLRAARMAGLREVPCLIAAVGEEDAALLALIENLQRRDLDYLEEAAAISRLIGRYGLSQQQAAEKLGKSQPAIANKLRRRPTYIIKDVRLFLNSVERGVRLMQSAGVGAEVGRCDTDEEILLTIHIPKRRPAGVVTDS